MEMTPAQTASRVPSSAGWASDLAAHLCRGYVVSTPEYFVMLRRVSSTAEREQLLDPWVAWSDAESDCWFVWLMAGDIARAVRDLEPALGRKKWLAFQRRGLPRVHPYEILTLWQKDQATQRR